MSNRGSIWIALLIILMLGSGCSVPTGDDLSGGGTIPPDGFYDRVDRKCRATDDKLSDDPPTIRQLNGQSLLIYQTLTGETLQCVVRHADESVIDMRLLGAED